MTQLRPLGRRPASIRAAAVRSREARLRAMERRVAGHLRYLRRHDPDGHAAFVAALRRILAQQSRRGR